MKIKTLSLTLLLSSVISFAQNATAQAATQPEYLSPYYPLVSDPYVSGTIALVRDITIIVVLWMFFYKYFGEKDKK